MPEAVSDFPWKYLLVDVDGTLLDSRGRISPRSRAVLERAVAAGMTLVLASGRTYPSLMRASGSLQLPFHMISNGGAVGLTPGMASVGYTNFLPPSAWPRVVEELQTEGLSTLVFSHRHPEPPLFHVGSLSGDPHYEAYLGRHREKCRLSEDLAGADIPDVVEVAALGAGEHFDAASARVIERLNGEMEGHSMVLFLDAQYGKITEFFRIGTSKWKAFLGLFPAAERNPERVIAVGDEANDLEMIRKAGLGIAMGNATPELKAVADRVTADHDHDGLAEALEPLLIGVAQG